MSRLSSIIAGAALVGIANLIIPAAHAALIVSNGGESFTGTDSVPGSGLTVVIAANSAWAPSNAFGTGSEWISYGNTKDSGPTFNSNMIVKESFVLSNPTQLLIRALADDTAQVRLLNAANNPIYNFNFNLSDPNGPCQLGVIGCVISPSNYALGALVAVAAAGLYTLEVTAKQLVDGTPFGMQYSVSTVPVPAAALLFGSALAGLAWMRRRWDRSESGAVAA